MVSHRQGQGSARDLASSTVGSAVARLAASATVLALCWTCVPCTPAWALTARDGGETSQNEQELALGMLAGGDREAAAREGTEDLLKWWQQLGLGGGTSYRLSYQARALALGGSLPGVGPRLRISGTAGGSTSAEEAEMLSRALGMRRVGLDAALTLAPGASLISRHNSARNGRPGDRQRGLTTTDVGHTLRWEVGPRSQLTASLVEHSEEWDRAVGKPGARRRERGMEFRSEFGGSGRHRLHLALTSTETKKGGRDKLERAREVHLNLAPTTRLRLNADYVAKGSEQGADQTTQSVGAVLRLTPAAELSGTIKRLAAEGSGGTRESSLKLSTKLGAGSTGGKLDAEEHVSRGEGTGSVRRRKWTLAGGSGSEGSRTELKADFEEKRGEGPSGKLARRAALHVVRALGRRLKLTAERQQQIGGTSAAPEVMVKSSCGLDAELRPGTSLSVGLVSEEKPSARPGWARRVALEHEFHRMKLRAEHQVRDEADLGLSVVSYGVDAPTGELPDWASEISRGHEFSEAQEYLIHNGPDWLEMPFAGYRFWAKQRRGGEDDGLDTLAFAHRRMIGDRYHLRLTYQECPEGEEGRERGRPMELRRGRLEVGMPVWRGLMARGGYQREKSLSAAGGHREGVSLGLWGKLSEGERMEANVSRDSGRWKGEGRKHTSVSLLYALEVREGHSLHLKLGYGWDDEETGARRRESRVSLGYMKPI